MKQRSTTPVSKFSRASFLAFVVVFSVATITGLFAQTSNAETNIERQAKIDELSKQIDEKVASTRELNTQGNDIQSQIDALKRERDFLLKELAKSKLRESELVQEMSDVEQKIAIQKELLGRAMADAYIDDTITPIEMLASSNSIGDFIDRQTMNTVVRDNLNDSIDEVRNLQQSLLAKQEEMKQIIGDQQNQAIALQNKQADQEKMLVATNDASGKLVEITRQMADERKALQNQQQTSMAAAMASAIRVTPGTISQPILPNPTPAPSPAPTPSPSTPAPAPSTPTQSAPAPTPAPVAPPAPEPVILPNGGYPSYLQNCYVDQYALSYGIDPWGYGCRQCVSYTAWKVLQKTGQMARYWGNAKDWPSSAARVGYAVGSTPRPGSVGVMTGGPYGHVVWVESVNANGTINISQYNYWLSGKPNGGWGWYSEFKNVSPYAYQAYVYV